MKTTLLMCLLATNCSWAADSLIVNAGPASRVIFYGKTPADLQKLERLDLNKLLRDLNQTKDSTLGHIQLSSAPYRATAKPLPKWQQYWQAYKKNTFFNLHLGMGSYTFFNQPIDRYEYLRLNDPSIFMENAPNKGLVISNSLWLRTRSVVGVSLVHDAYWWNGKRMGMKFRYGVGVEALGLRYQYSNVVKVDSELFPNNEWSSPRSDYYQNTLMLRPEQTDVRAFSYNFQLMPKVFLKNKKGKETFSLGLGVRYNVSRMKQPLDGGGMIVGWGVYPIDSDKVLGGRVTATSGPIVASKDMYFFAKEGGLKNFTYMAEMGYRSVSLFFNYTPSFTQITPSLTRFSTSNAQYYNQQSGKLGFINFGVKIGR
ncbi:hypothetical protein [Runella sp. SP2]|uniref:hypothetical protein n=1 Tax=Runella sp. SP2 TaxID=2268026 RepID=UPI000F090320|nr:hypothetical protein [Runella sp. SP2]AYQ35926.1 hypothetical protein DTQ70_28875 [Runella sp. SP2]